MPPRSIAPASLGSRASELPPVSLTLDHHLDHEQAFVAWVQPSAIQPAASREAIARWRLVALHRVLVALQDFLERAVRRLEVH